MKVDGRLEAGTIEEMASSARRQEGDGCAALWTSETAHDPFLPLVLAAEHTSRVELGCAIAVAFARNPMSVAYLAHDLQAYSGGRFVLGLGSQIKPHVERRFGMKWSDPVKRMEEFVAAVRAVLSAWESGEPLRFAGSYYRHTLMTPFFSPAPHGHGLPRVFLAAVGTSMTEAAGRVADGVFVHAFATPRYVRERVMPAVTRGLASAGRDRAGFEVSCRGFLATGRDDAELAEAKDAVRAQVAFYASTPAYRPVLDLHGWGELGERLHALSTSADPGRWAKMASMIDDTVLGTFAVVAEPDRAAVQITERYEGLADRYRFYHPYRVAPEVVASIARQVARL